MRDRTEQLRKQAAECIALATKAAVPEVRMGLLAMAQQLYEIAHSDPERVGQFNRAVRAFNDDQMSRH